MILALVQANVVVEIVTDDPSNYAAYSVYQAAIDITDTVPQPQVGWTFDGSKLKSNGTVDMKITRIAFRERFTQTELLTVLGAIAAGGTVSLILQMMQQNVEQSTFIDLARSDTQAGVQELVTLGLLTQQRATIILTTPPTAIEVYQG